MANEKEIRSKIRSVKNMQKITKAMEMVAASKMRKAQERMAATRPYAANIRRVIGHIAFSPVTISDGTPNWYGLGPVSVLPEYQRKGIGKALIEEGLSRLKDLNAQGCCLVGHPDYYRKVGFENTSGLVHEGVPQEVFLALSFEGHIPQGTVAFHEGFKADGQQGAEDDAVNRMP